MFQGFPIALAQIKGGNTSENLQSEMSQIIYSMHRANESTKTYLIMNSMQL